MKNKLIVTITTEKQKTADLILRSVNRTLEEQIFNGWVKRSFTRAKDKFSKSVLELYFDLDNCLPIIIPDNGMEYWNHKKGCNKLGSIEFNFNFTYAYSRDGSWDSNKEFADCYRDMLKKFIINTDAAKYNHEFISPVSDRLVGDNHIRHITFRFDEQSWHFPKIYPMMRVYGVETFIDILRGFKVR